MKNKQRALHGSVTTFANDLRQLAQLVNDGVSFLSKSIQQKPCIGPSEFQEILSDIQEEVVDLTTEVETLERLTIDSISFEELLGHCVALYQANRSTIEHLEAHLQQYGYRQPPGIVVEPENPLSAERIAAAAVKTKHKGYMQGVNGISSSDEDEDEEEDSKYCTNVKKVAPSRSFEMLTIGQPALVSTVSVSFQNKNRRRGTPVGKAWMVSYCSSESESEGGGNGCAKDASAMECDTGITKRFPLDIHQSTYLPPGADAMAVVGTVAGRVRPTGAMTGKSHILLSTQTASLSAAAAAAASVHASARKTPRSRAAANRDVSPERLYSPYTSKLLAKLNPPEATREDENERCPISLAVSFDMACLPDIATTELSAAMRDLAPFERSSRDVGGLGAVLRTVQIGSADASAAESKLGQPRASAGPPPPPVPADDMDTCTLYQELIRKPATTMPQPQQTKPFIPPLNLGQFITSALPQSEPVLSQRQPLQQSQQQPVSQGVAGSTRLPPPLSPRPPLPPPAGSTPERERPAAVVASGGSSRCATPLSALRANREQHNKLLAEKMAGLEREWIESGQAALTPMRRSMGGGSANGDLQPYVRGKSPGPSRALAEAAAAAAAALLAPPVTAWGAEQSLQGASQSHKDVESRPRVLSPLQPFCTLQTATSTPAAHTSLNSQHRTSRGSGLPGPLPQAGSGGIVATTTSASAAAAVAAAAAAAALAPTAVAAAAASSITTVVGATMLPRRDVSAGDASLRSSVASKPVAPAVARTPTRLSRGIGTPGRLPHASSNSPVGAIGAMGMTPSRRTESATPRGGMRTALATTTGAAEVRTSRVTPHRKSYTAAPLEAAAVAAAAAAAVAIEPLSATPGRAQRLASAAMMTDATASVTVPRASTSNAPSHIRAASAVAAAAAATAAPLVVSQLRLDDCRRPESANGAGGVRTGSPRSRRGLEVDNRLGAHPVSVRPGMDTSDAGSSPDEVTLGMPPAVSNPNTPTPATPGGRSSTGGIPASGMPSPNATRLASHPLGDIFGGSSRPSSRIPTPGKIVTRHSRLQTRASASGSGLTVASSTASFASLEPCHEEEWRGLPGSLQLAFPMDVLTGHMRALAQVLASRPATADASAGICFSAADLEPLSMNSATAKRLLYTLVKLGRCQVVGGGGMGGGSMLYRLST